MQLTKRILSLGLAIGMMLTMSVGASAANGDVSGVTTNKKVDIVSHVGSGHRLNMYTSSVNSIKNTTNVTTWNTKDNGGTQDWYITKFNMNANEYVIKVNNNHAYSLNLYRDSTYNANLYAIASNSVADYVVRFVDEDASFGGNDTFGIVLPAHGICLTTMDSESMIYYGGEYGYNVKWRAPQSNSGVLASQAWNVNIKW